MRRGVEVGVQVVQRWILARLRHETFMSLAALNEKEAACASLGEVSRKYPRASLNVKQSVDREQKRVGC